jgi:hypothetical protein
MSPPTKKPKQRPRFGEMLADWNGLNIIENVFAVSRGEGHFTFEHGHPIMGMFQILKLAFDQHRNQIPKGKTEQIEDFILELGSRCSVVESGLRAERLLVKDMIAAGHLSQQHAIDWSNELDRRQLDAVRSMANNCGRGLVDIQNLIKPRTRGRPKAPVIPKLDPHFHCDREVFFRAAASVNATSQEPQLDQVLKALPNALDQSWNEFYAADNIGDPALPHRARRYTLERLQRLATSILTN